MAPLHIGVWRQIWMDSPQITSQLVEKSELKAKAQYFARHTGKAQLIFIELW